MTIETAILHEQKTSMSDSFPVVNGEEGFILPVSMLVKSFVKYNSPQSSPHEMLEYVSTEALWRSFAHSVQGSEESPYKVLYEAVKYAG